MPIKLDASAMARPQAPVAPPHENSPPSPVASTQKSTTQSTEATFDTGPTTVTIAEPEPQDLPHEVMPASPEEAAADHVERRVQEHLSLLANDDALWNEAMTSSMGSDYDRAAASQIRGQIRDGAWESVLPTLRWEDPTNLDGRSSALDVEAGDVRLSSDLVQTPEKALAFFTEEVGRHLGTKINARGAEGTIAGTFKAYADPTIDVRHERYQQREAANLESLPLGFEGASYGTNVDAPLIVDDKQPPYVLGAHGTGPQVGELRDAGAANFLTPQWMEQVSDAVQRNGGLGDAENGFLAFSKEFGWVRMRNDNLSPEQNRRLAAISLQMGWPIEDMPSRETENTVDQENVQRWVTTFFERFDTEFEAFQDDPKDGIAFKDGRRRYELKYDEGAGRFISFNYKKSGGLRGWVQKNAKWMGPVLDGLSIVGHAIPGVGTAIALGAQALKTAASWIATGKVKAQQLVATVGSFFLPGAAARLGQARALAGFGAAQVAAEVIDTGEVSARSIAGAVTPLIPGLTGSAVADALLQNGVNLTAQAVDTGRIRAGDVLSALTPLGTQVSPDVWKSIVGVGKALEDGKLDASELGVVLDPLLGKIAPEDRDRERLRLGLQILLKGIEERSLPAETILRALGKELVDRLKAEVRGRAA